VTPRLARTFHQGRGRTSGVEAAMTVFHLLTIRDAKIVQMRMYYDEAEARAAATAAG
jgi:YD repeat-containing protein